MKTLPTLLLLGIIPITQLSAGSSTDKKGSAMAISMISSAFRPGDSIPSKYTCDGANVSPPLTWSGAPAGTKSLALICDDPDAPSGTWVHWVLFGLPATTSELAGNQPTSGALPSGAKQGTNDFGKTGYGGPCPPPGKPHHYHFKLYALDAEPKLESGATKQELLHAIRGHIMGEAQLVGTYQRKR